MQAEFQISFLRHSVEQPEHSIIEINIDVAFQNLCRFSQQICPSSSSESKLGPGQGLK